LKNSRAAKEQQLQKQKHAQAMEKLKAEFDFSEASKKTLFPEPKKTILDSTGSGFI